MPFILSLIGAPCTYFWVQFTFTMYMCIHGVGFISSYRARGWWHVCLFFRVNFVDFFFLHEKYIVMAIKYTHTQNISRFKKPKTFVMLRDSTIFFFFFS